MSLNNLQSVMFNYLCENKLFSKLLPFYRILTVIYGIYSVLYNIRFLNGIMSFLWIIGGLLFFISILGLIISFAKNDMIPIMILFALLSISNIFEIISYISAEYTGIRFIMQSLVYFVIYMYLAYIAMVRFNKTGGR